ncbi:SpoIIE family protein phosphatase [Sphaerisporangium viridialbum]|uniref:SpoIIE family protein phosphatase n=1 Tax=Sphaerisporangium viridialbum TaxID=46189 RepID=UPI003C72DAA1
MPGHRQVGEQAAQVEQTDSWWERLPVGLVIADGAGRLVQWDMAAQELLGYTAEEVIGHDWTEFVLPGERAAARALLEAVASGRSLTGSFPVRHKDGSTVDLEVWACPAAGYTGGRWGVLSLVADARWARQVHRASALVDGLFARSPVGLAVFDTDLRFQQVNPALEAINGVPGADHIGKRLTQVLPGLNFEQIEAAMRRVLATGDPVVNFRCIGRTPAEPDHDRVWSCSYFRLEDTAGRPLGISASVIDVPPHQREDLDTAADRQRLELLNEAMLRIGTTLDMARTGQELTDLAVPRLADIATVDVLTSVTDAAEPLASLAGGGALLRLGKAPLYGSPAADILAPVGHILHFPTEAPYTRALIDRRPFLLPRIDAGTVARAARHTPTPERLWRLGVHSVMMVPLVARGLTLGVAIFLRGSDSPAAFDPTDLAIAGDLAAHAAVCIDNARLYNREHDTALTLQRSMLPCLSRPPDGIEIAHCYLPASEIDEVGGDWYDVTILDRGKAALVIGDVMGHGIPAAAVMGQMRTTVRALARLGLPPDQLLHHLDATIQELDDPLLATCVYAVCDANTGTCRLTRAGHPPPAVITPDGAAHLLDLPPGSPLGIGGIPYTTTEIALGPGSILVFYTDGLIEARGCDLDERLTELTHVLEGEHRTLAELRDTLLTRVAPTPAQDDIAILIARIGSQVPSP